MGYVLTNVLVISLGGSCLHMHLYKVEPQFNKGLRDWKIMCATNKVSLYQGSFPYIFLVLGQRILFIIIRQMFLLARDWS